MYITHNNYPSLHTAIDNMITDGGGCTVGVNAMYETTVCEADLNTTESVLARLTVEQSYCVATGDEDEGTDIVNANATDREAVIVERTLNDLFENVVCS